MPFASIFPRHFTLELTFYVTTHKVSAATEQMNIPTRRGFDEIS
jgi:hypothetical protein